MLNSDWFFPDKMDLHIFEQVKKIECPNQYPQVLTRRYLLGKVPNQGPLSARDKLVLFIGVPQCDD